MEAHVKGQLSGGEGWNPPTGGGSSGGEVSDRCPGGLADHPGSKTGCALLSLSARG